MKLGISEGVYHWTGTNLLKVSDKTTLSCSVILLARFIVVQI